MQRYVSLAWAKKYIVAGLALWIIAWVGNIFVLFKTYDCVGELTNESCSQIGLYSIAAKLFLAGIIIGGVLLVAGAILWVRNHEKRK